MITTSSPKPHPTIMATVEEVEDRRETPESDLDLDRLRLSDKIPIMRCSDRDNSKQLLLQLRRPMQLP